jgi:hypothetical protein
MFGSRWTESIAQKMRRKKKTEDLNARKEIWRSVFEPYIPPSHGDLGYVSYYSTPKTSDLVDHPCRPKLWTTGLRCLRQNLIRQ